MNDLEKILFASNRIISGKKRVSLSGDGKKVNSCEEVIVEHTLSEILVHKPEDRKKSS